MDLGEEYLPADNAGQKALINPKGNVPCLFGGESGNHVELAGVEFC